MSILETVQSLTQSVAGAAGPSAVRIGRGRGRGGGFVFAEGTVVTNAHNLRGEEVTVTFADGRTALGTVAAADTDGDLAAISVETGEAPPLPWSDEVPTTGLAVWVAAPAPGGSLRVTQGAVAATGARFHGPGGHPVDGAVEHTAPLARGSSGTPLLDAAGRLVGINTHRRGDGFYLAIPATPALRERLQGLAAGEAPARRRLGVVLAPRRVAEGIRAAAGLSPQSGLLIRAVLPEGPAAAAGLAEGDLLVRAGDQDLATPDDLAVVLAAAGDTLVVTALRGESRRDVEVHFAPAGEAG